MSWYRKLAGQLVEHGASQETDADVVAYGIQTGVEMLLNILSTAIIGFVLGMVLESLIFLASYILVRSYTGGYHAESALACYLQSCSLIAISMLFCRLLPARFILPVAFTLLFLAGPVIFFLAPVAATHKPLDQLEKAYYQKQSRIRISIAALLVLFLSCISFSRYALVLSTGLFLIAVLMIVGLLKNRLFPAGEE